MPRVDLEPAGEHLKGVILKPTHENGRFLIDDAHFGERTIGKIALKGIDAEDAYNMSHGHPDILDIYLEVDEGSPGTVRFVNCYGEVELSALPDTGDVVSVRVEEFTELTPVREHFILPV